MPRGLTANPGPWKNERTPYLVGIMDAISEPGVEQVVFLKPVQVGYSECVRNILGHVIDNDPGPTLLVMPTQQSAEELVEERIRPLLSETPRLRQYVSSDRSDNRVNHTKLLSMSIFIGWAGSPQALASRPIRYVIFDEVDKYPAFAGKESDPISLGLKRLTTYGSRSRALIGSTPTTRTGPIWAAWENCTQRRYFHVPCPECGHEQALRWQQVRWPDRRDDESRPAHAERIEADQSARYHCEACDAAWTDPQKIVATRSGRWVSDGGSNRRVGFHLNSIYSPWVSISKLAGEFLRSHGNPALLMDFANSRLAEPFEEQTSHSNPTVFEEKAKLGGPPMVCPAWAVGAFLTADVQKDHAWYVIRAWGPGGRSQLIRYGIVSTLAELPVLAFQGTFATSNGEAAACQFMAIDARYRQDEVYALAARDPARILPVVGSDRLAGMPVQTSAVKGYGGVVKRTVNPNHWKDVLQGLIHSDDPTQWLPHNQIGPDYSRQMASEHKIRDPRTGAMYWKEVSSGADNHLWDCEVMQVMLATEAGVFVMTD